MSRRWTVLPLLALLFLTAGDRVSAQEVASISVDPVSQTVGPTEGEFVVRLLVDDVTSPQGLGGYTLVMSYDPDVLHGLSVTDSGYVESTENPVICPASGIDNDAGQLAHLCLTVPIFSEPGPQPSEPQVLATITFEPVGEGSTTLDISETTLIDPEGNELAATTSNGAVTVGSAGAALPTQPASDATPEAAEPDSDGGGNAGLFIGLVVGGLVIVALLGAGLGLARWRRGAGS